MSLRSIRRHHVKRLKKNRSSYWGYINGKDRDNTPMTDRMLGRLVSTSKPCACWMCGNHRKVFGKPFSQLRLEQNKFYDDEENSSDGEES